MVESCYCARHMIPTKARSTPQAGSEMKKVIVAVATIWTVVAPASAIEPRSIKSASSLKADQGALRISVRSQVQLGGTLHLWFLRDGGDPNKSSDVLKFERKQGVPLAGTNTIDSRPIVYQVPEGRYRLLAHGVNCDGVPPENSLCVLRIGGSFSIEQPTGRYGEPSPAFAVVAGALTDAGEYVLELPLGSKLGERISSREAIERNLKAAIRWRPIAAPLLTTFVSVTAGPSPSVPAEFRSNLRCEIKPKDATGMMLFYPFEC